MKYFGRELPVVSRGNELGQQIVDVLDSTYNNSPPNVYGEVRRMANKIYDKNKISTESDNVEIKRDKGVNSTGLLGF